MRLKPSPARLCPARLSLIHRWPVRLGLVFSILMLLVLSLGGCLPKSKAWNHPMQADPRKEDLLFVEDTKFCEDKIGSQPQGDARVVAMAGCLKRLGWVPKEKD